MPERGQARGGNLPDGWIGFRRQLEPPESLGWRAVYWSPSSPSWKSEERPGEFRVVHPMWGCSLMAAGGQGQAAICL